MKTLKKVLAICLTLVLVLSFAGCHQKDEVAVKSGDKTFTSAFYMCALLNADMAARTKIDEKKAEENKNTSSTSSTTTTATDYFAEKIDGKSFEEYVKETALNTLRRFIYVKQKCDENKLTLTDSEIANTDYMTQYYWAYYGYATVFEANGVSLNTYLEYCRYALYEEKYFLFLYGKDGEKAISEDAIKNHLYGNYVIADVLSASVSDKADNEKALVQTKFEGYKTRLEKGETFKAIYNEYNDIKEEETTTSSATSSTTSEETAKKPLDEYAQVVGSKDTSYSSDHFETIKAMATNEIKFVKDDENGYYYLFVKKDIKADPYYLDYLNNNVISDLKFDEFDEATKTEMAKVEIETVAFAINQFKVKKIVYPY